MRERISISYAVREEVHGVCVKKEMYKWRGCGIKTARQGRRARDNRERGECEDERANRLGRGKENGVVSEGECDERENGC